LALLASAGGAGWWYSRPPLPPPINVATRSDEDLEDPRVVNSGYLGPQACAACHAERVAEFLETSHFKTFRIPDPAVMPRGFSPGNGTYTSLMPGLRFEMTRAGKDFFQTSIRSGSVGEQRTRARIDLVLGAGGKADEVYLTWDGDRLKELPMAWMFELDRWGCSHINRHGSGDYSRESTLRCLECHNTWFEHVPGSANQYRPDSFLMGVTCERCHGPGSDHVKFHQSHPGAETGQKIVRPSGLIRERQLEVCTQCHSNAIQNKGPALSYRPGVPLEDHYRTLIAPRNTEDDHVANQIKYLRQSTCFQKSERLTCTTCHNPHRRERPDVVGIQSCLKCHQTSDCGEQKHLPAEVQTRCVACHMPSHLKINVNFETEDDNYVPPMRRCDHRIAVHLRARDGVLLEWFRSQPGESNRTESDRLTGTLADDWLAEAEACRLDYRFMGAIAALREACRLDPAPANRAALQAAVATQDGIDRALADAVQQVGEHDYQQAIDTLDGILRIKPDHAKAHGKLGTAYAAIGQKELAVQHWEAVAKYDPDDPYGHSMIAWQSFLENRAEDSLEFYRRADEVDPYLAPINYRWGLALARLGRWDEAAARFRYVLEIDPFDAGGSQGLALALSKQGNLTKALAYARRAARYSDFKNLDILLTLTDAYEELGRYAEAADAADKALNVALNSNAQAAPRILKRLERLRIRSQSPAGMEDR